MADNETLLPQTEEMTGNADDATVISDATQTSPDTTTDSDAPMAGVATETEIRTDGEDELAGETEAEDVEQQAVEAEVPAKKPRTRIVKSVEATAPKTEEAEVSAVDFADEDAELAADAEEFRLDESDADEAQHNVGILAELVGKTKRQLVDLFDALLADRPVQQLRRDAEAIKVAFYKKHRADVEAIKAKFIEEGGVAEDFVAAVDKDEQKLKEVFGAYRKKRDEYIALLEDKKEESLAIKLKIIEDLKELIDKGETLNHTFNAFRDLQQRWRNAGAVPQTSNKDIWETYNHHVEQFYNYIKINKELRDLDLKRNYEAKLKLCEAADALLMEPSVVSAFNKLQKLHEEWRDTGPVAAEYKDVLWERFRDTSSRVNKLHQEHFEKIKEEQKVNLERKAELCEKTEELAGAQYASRKDWNKASEKLEEIQKAWKTIGFAPKKDNTRIYERFRKACDRFFENKRHFYLGLKDEMETNYTLKNELVEMVEALKESEEWQKVTDEIIAIQKRWKEIGPVARRHSDAIWKRFRAACDHFFERKSTQSSAQGAQQDENLQRKRELLDRMAQTAAEEVSFNIIKEFQREWSEVGYVPIKFKDAISKEYKTVMDNMFNIARGKERGKPSTGGHPNRGSEGRSSGGGFHNDRDRSYVRVRQLEADIAQLENNIGFFARSKGAESIIRDVQNKIERAKEEMAREIEKIKMIDSEQ